MRDELLKRRSLMFEAVPEPPGSLISDYVQSGLLMHMDGKEKGGTDAWVSRVNGYSFTRYGATFNSDHVYFDGVDDYLISSSPTGTNIPASNAGTIEFVCDNEGFGVQQGVIFMPRTTSKLAANIAATGMITVAADNTSSRTRATRIMTQQKASISVSNTFGYQNGVAMEQGANNYINDVNANYNYIGRRKSGAYFKGKIYSIRIYTRKLTQAEIMQNLSVDNLRFRLGLTLQ